MEQFVHGGNIYETKPVTGEWLDFSANVNMLGLAPAVRAAVAAGIDQVVHYPDPEARELKQAISQHYNLPVEQIVLGNGAAELFYLFFQTIRPRRVLLPVPSFSEYERAALAARCRVNYFELAEDQDFRLDWDDFMGALPVSDCIILGNPNNPTGSLITRNELVHLLNELKGGAQWLVVDESFLDFLLYDSRYTVRDLVAEYPQLFVIQSLTKFYALPGLRLGFGVAAPGLVQRLEAGKDVWNVNCLAQRAGVAALSDADYQQASRKQLVESAQQLFDELGRINGLRPLRPSVNFILIDVRETGHTSTELTALLREQGVLIRDCANYPGLDGQSYVRTAVRTPLENQQLLKALEAVLK